MHTSHLCGKYLLFLVWFIISVWVSDLGQDVILVLEYVVADAGKVRVLEIGIEILPLSAYVSPRLNARHTTLTTP